VNKRVDLPGGEQGGHGSPIKMTYGLIQFD
jgi:hypothetical protein